MIPKRLSIKVVLFFFDISGIHHKLSSSGFFKFSRGIVSNLFLCPPPFRVMPGDGSNVVRICLQEWVDWTAALWPAPKKRSEVATEAAAEWPAQDTMATI